MSYRDFERQNSRLSALQTGLIAAALALFAAGIILALYVVSQTATLP